jgi:hypothetical protein
MTVPYDKIVEKLARDTAQGDVKWSVVPYGAIDRNNVVGLVYQASVKGQDIVVYEYRYKHYDDQENWEYEREVAIEFTIGGGYALELRFPPTRARWSLLENIRAQASGAEDFARKFLTNDSNDDA